MSTTSMRVTFPTNENIVRLGRVSRDCHYRLIMMMALSKANEESMKTKGFITDPNGNVVDNDKVLFYGNVDPNDADDKEAFEGQQFIWCDVFPGSFIPRDFDYETSTGSTIELRPGVNVLSYVETLSSWRMFLFGHCRLGKPSKIVVFEKLVRKRKFDINA